MSTLAVGRRRNTGRNQRHPGSYARPPAFSAGATNCQRHAIWRPWLRFRFDGGSRRRTRVGRRYPFPDLAGDRGAAGLRCRSADGRFCRTRSTVELHPLRRILQRVRHRSLPVARRSLPEGYRSSAATSAAGPRAPICGRYQCLEAGDVRAPSEMAGTGCLLPPVPHQRRRRRLRPTHLLDPGRCHDPRRRRHLRPPPVFTSGSRRNRRRTDDGVRRQRTSTGRTVAADSRLSRRSNSLSAVAEQSVDSRPTSAGRIPRSSGRRGRHPCGPLSARPHSHFRALLPGAGHRTCRVSVRRDDVAATAGASPLEGDRQVPGASKPACPGRNPVRGPSPGVLERFHRAFMPRLPGHRRGADRLPAPVVVAVCGGGERLLYGRLLRRVLGRPRPTVSTLPAPVFVVVDVQSTARPGSRRRTTGRWERPAADALRRKLAIEMNRSKNCFQRFARLPIRSTADSQTVQFAEINSTWLGTWRATLYACRKMYTSRPTRHASHAFWHWEKSWRVALVWQHGATRSSRRARLVFRGVEPQRGMGWTCPPHFQKLFLRLMQIQSAKNYTPREHQWFFVVRHVGTSTARHARHDALDMSCRVEKWRDELSGIWAITTHCLRFGLSANCSVTSDACALMKRTRYTGWTKKLSHYRITKNSIKARQWDSLGLHILCVTYFLTCITMPGPQTSDMRQIR